MVTYTTSTDLISQKAWANNVGLLWSQQFNVIPDQKKVHVCKNWKTD